MSSESRILGPSYGIQGSDAASGLALEKAYQSILTGECDAAIVGGSSLCLKKMQNLTLMNKNMFSSSGLCQPFDEDGEYKLSKRLMLVKSGSLWSARKLKLGTHKVFE